MTSLVMNLVKRNIKGKNTLIVVTLPMTGTMQIQAKDTDYLLTRDR